MVEVIPMLQLRRLPHPIAGVAGIVNYRGRPVPAVDLSALTTGTPAAERLSTRIVIINHESAEGQAHAVGLIAEQATETLACDSQQFSNSGPRCPGAPWLGPIFTDPRGSIQWLYQDRLLPAALQKALFEAAPTIAP